MDVFTDAVVTPCAHTFCRECLGVYLQLSLFDQAHNLCTAVNVLNGPEHAQDVNDPIRYKVNERPCMLFFLTSYPN